jgi:DNA polymerase-3 subunit gamma/tau
MPSQALYRKWRSRTFDEVVAQDHVTRTLSNALRSGRIAHAYLFTGPRGTGKTSTARLLAKAVNCTGPEGRRPCNQCPTCLAVEEGRLMDLIEIDAASNRGIDEIRDLREKVNFRPTEARFKVYVIDEVHMLTNEAFNALLKTLEEPPPHVIFVLATTEPHKIPATVLSRCQRFDFRRIPAVAVVERLRVIAREEGIQAEDEALEFIARQSTGSLRDAVSLLDQLVSYGGATISLDQVQSVLGLVPRRLVQDLVGCLVGGDIGGGLSVLNDAASSGADALPLSREIVEYLRGLLLTKMSGDVKLLNVAEDERAVMKAQAEAVPLSRLVEWVKAFNQAGLEVRLAVNPQLPLELAVVSALTVEQPAVPVAPVAAARPAVKPVPAVPASSPSFSSAASEPVTPAAPSESPAAPAGELTLDSVVARWPAILTEVQAVNRTASSLLGQATLLAVEVGEVTIGFESEPLRDLFVKDPKKSEYLQAAALKVLGQVVRIKCTVVPKGQSPVARSAEMLRPPLTDKPRARAADPPSTGVSPAPSSADGETPGDAYPDPTHDRVIREAVERFGARVSGVQRLSDGQEK